MSRTSLVSNIQPHSNLLHHSLLQHNLRGSFAVEAEGAVRQFDHRTHGFTHRVERVYLRERNRNISGNKCWTVDLSINIISADV